MFGFHLLAQIPISYIFSTLFKNQKGFLYGIKEIVAFFYVRNSRRGVKRRLDFYDLDRVAYDLEKLAIRIPPQEYQLEYRRSLSKSETESVLFYGGTSTGTTLVTKVSRNAKGLTSIWLRLELDNGVRYHLPEERFWVEPKTGLESFVGGGLRLKCLIPMRRWRISFNGLLERTIDNEKKAVHVKFGFVCVCSSGPQDPASDIHPKTWASFLAGETNWAYKINETRYQADRWIQSINLIGEIEITEDNVEKGELYLWGARRRDNNDQVKIVKKAHSKEYLFYFKSGEFLHYGEINLPSANNKLSYAYIVNSTSLGGPARKAIVRKDAKGNEIISFTRGPFTRHVILKKPEESKTLLLNNGDDLSTVTEVSMVDAVLDGDEIGHGLIMEYSGKTAQPLPLPKIQLPALSKAGTTKLVLPLTSSDCRRCDVSGGKGSSLAELTILADKLGENSRISVPRGVVVTTSAYRVHVEESKLNEMIEPLVIISREDASLLKHACERASNGFNNRSLPRSVKDAVKQNLLSTFGTDAESIRFAIRSSASGEDSEELSAAGQMSTFLGVKGFERIYEAVIKCWASQFSFVAIQYKRENGQILNSPMAVVIQEMVAADVAGVTFTRDPVTGNPKQLTISANYGLGESVVSAAADPDTITVKRHPNGIVGVTKVDVGKKNTRIVQASGDDGVKEEKVSEEMSRQSSVSVEDALRLAEIAILVEESYGLPVDIEWAFRDQKLYLLQARPITTFDKEGETELAHELDSPIRSEDEYFSTANVGEVMPGAFSHLGCVVMNKGFDTVMRWHISPRGKYNFPSNPYFLRGMGRTQNHALFNVFDALLRFYHGKRDLVSEAQMVSMLGRILEDERMFEMARKRNEFYPPNSVLTQSSYILWDMIFCNRFIRNARNKCWHYKLDLSKAEDSDSFHREFWHQWLEVLRCSVVHMTATMTSSFYNIFLLSILTAGNKGWGPAVYKDFAYVLSSCYEVESVDVPNDIEKLSETIAKSTNAKSFKEMKTEDALDWLETTGSEAGVAFKRFIEQHGHRCYKEFDVMSNTWRDDPLGLVNTLRNMACMAEKTGPKKRPIGTYETMKNLSVPLNWIQKILVMIAIPLCRKAVGMRERSKSLTIRIFDKARKAYRELAELLVKEGRLPRADLIFYLTNEEIDLLIKSRSPTLLQKAVRRRALLPAMDKLIFPELSSGIPKAINYETRVNREGTLKLKGTPVSNGVAEGLARVATSLEEASHLRPGEILIAYSTDIGWSPFFPMLAGVATELGGLVSHGAVVAREYGLPCVVAVQGATMMFKTGDRVFLNGNKGTLERIEETASD